MKFWNLAPDPEIPEDGVLEIDGEIVADAAWFDPEDRVCVARDFREQLKQYGDVHVRINSPGGDVMAGADMYAALREHSMNGRGHVTVEITAVAASAASVVAMAGDTIQMYPTSYMVIHNPWSLAIGDAKEMRKMARTLDAISEGIIAAYQQRTGKTRDELKRMLDNETWMSAGTCLQEGFADEIVGWDSKAAAKAGGLTRCMMSARSHGAQEIAARIGADAEPDLEGMAREMAGAGTSTLSHADGEAPEDGEPVSNGRQMWRDEMKKIVESIAEDAVNRAQERIREREEREAFAKDAEKAWRECLARMGNI